eukprot:1160183-Pelagomonas_calceolata.AAC.3
MEVLCVCDVDAGILIVERLERMSHECLVVMRPALSENGGVLAVVSARLYHFDRVPHPWGVH